MAINYDISRPRVLEVIELNKKLVDNTPVAIITDKRTGRQGTGIGEWVDELKLGSKTKVRWERTKHVSRSDKISVKWSLRPVK